MNLILISLSCVGLLQGSTRIREHGIYQDREGGRWVYSYFCYECRAGWSFNSQTKTCFSEADCSARHGHEMVSINEMQCFNLLSESDAGGPKRRNVDNFTAYTASSGNLLIRFTSNRNTYVSRPGFTATWSTANASATVTCSGDCECTPSTGTTSGTISDGPSDYDNNADCSWLISSSSEIHLSITSFHLESCCDYVTLNQCDSTSSDGQCNSAQQIARMNGGSLSSCPCSSLDSSAGQWQTHCVGGQCQCYKCEGEGVLSWSRSGQRVCQSCPLGTELHCPSWSGSAGLSSCGCYSTCPEGQVTKNKVQGECNPGEPGRHAQVRQD